MKIDYNSITKDKPVWKVGDVIQDVDINLYLVARVADLGGNILYTLINLEDGYSSDSYKTIAELQHHTGDSDDSILTGTFKYEADK